MRPAAVRYVRLKEGWLGEAGRIHAEHGAAGRADVFA